MEKEDIYCHDCGSDGQMHYIENYANGSEYRCAICGWYTIVELDKED